MTATQALLGIVAFMLLIMAVIAVACMVVAVRTGRPPRQKPKPHAPIENGRMRWPETGSDGEKIKEPTPIE